MQQYFISKEDLEKNRITGDDVFHIRSVMRGRVGDKFIVTDESLMYLVSIVSIEKDVVNFKKEEAMSLDTELPFFVDIYQGYPKGDKLDDICKHSTELGVNKVYAVNMKRSIVKIDPKKLEAKTLRYDTIMKEASEQSHRTRKAHFGGIIDLKKIDFSNYDSLILAYEESAKQGEYSNFRTEVLKMKEGSRMAILIGPEGGIDETEVKYLTKLGFIPSGLGKRILRTETASLYALAAISYESELK
ncbi:MAG: 16S rRNA (uracil(1498)-N(3))-methyltransferase [Acholeplasmatales bacterium]|nr:16S rRNA (uracil(1498)-N(3))-methyltransferase [Acholeplasmatales bacterium]